MQKERNDVKKIMGKSWVVKKDVWQKKERKTIWRHGMNNARNAWKTRENGPNSSNKHCLNPQ
jgi:hypothetical protein